MKRTSILEEFYFGKLGNWVTGAPTESEYKEMKNKLDEMRTHFQSIMSSETERQLFDEYENLQSESSDLEQVHIFKCGVSFMFLVMADIFDFLEQ